MAQPVVHFEMWSEEPGRISEFYEQVFEWQIDRVPDLDYHLVRAADKGIGGGIMKPKSGPMPAKMTFYIDVDDLAAYGKKVVDAGGKLLVDQMEVPGVGSLSLFEDPDGRVVGMWKQLPHGK